MTLAVVALAALLTLPASASGHQIKVSPGESIQAAIDQASPGDTVKIRPGTYRENLLIAKDGITLRGSGAGRTRLEPPANPAPVCVVPEALHGICVADIDPSFNVISTVEDVRITRLSVHDFRGIGIFFFGVSGAKVDHVLAAGNDEYGIAAFNSTNGRYTWNLTPDNGEAGIYLGDSPQARSEVEHNASWDNAGFGIFIRDASFGRIKKNVVTGNCIGMIFLNTGAGAAHWTGERNLAIANDRACPGDEAEGEPGLSGAGIVVAGAKDVRQRSVRQPALGRLVHLRRHRAGLDGVLRGRRRERRHRRVQPRAQQPARRPPVGR
jgi:nitrous oxidase accessory protein NosD